MHCLRTLAPLIVLPVFENASPLFMLAFIISVLVQQKPCICCTLLFIFSAICYHILTGEPLLSLNNWHLLTPTVYIPTTTTNNNNISIITTVPAGGILTPHEILTLVGQSALFKSNTFLNRLDWLHHPGCHHVFDTLSYNNNNNSTYVPQVSADLISFTIPYVCVDVRL